MVRARAVNTAHVKWLALLVAVALFFPLALWALVQTDDRVLSGLTIQGVPAAQTARALQRQLRERADLWEQEEVEIAIVDTASPVRTTRAALGARLPIEPMVRAAQQTGRSGNPLLDLSKWLDAQRGKLDLHWSAVIDGETLTRFVESQQLRVEEPPIAGVSDGHGFSLPGRDGRALDLASAVATLSRTLSSGQRVATLPVLRVAAPAPLVIGSPDGALFNEESQPEEHTKPPQFAIATSGGLLLPAQVPGAWMPANSNDCFSDPPQRPFCDGPRMVPQPYGPAAELAQQLKLGTIETVGHLIHRAPKPEWVRAAGGPLADTGKDWPVPAGKLGRGFGFVRREELRDRIHAGLDIVAPRGSAIRAAAPGIVAYADNRVRGYGNLLVIVHEGGEVTLNAHCQRIFVFPGQIVGRGQTVAEVGMTGLAMGPHLHFEYRVAGEPVDSLPLFAAPGARK